MEIISSTQGVTAVQKSAAIALGVPENRIVSKVKRIGMYTAKGIMAAITLALYIFRWWVWRKGNSAHLFV